MATQISTPPRQSRQPGVASSRFTWAFVVLCVWLMAGAYLDSWHHHNLARPETNFLNPYHYVLYSGMAAIGIFLGLNVIRNYRRYGTWEELLPDGYGVSLLGTVLFAVGGGFDFLWHSRFGFEVSMGLLFSPPHLFLMLTGALLVSPVANHVELVIVALLAGVAGDLLLYVLRPSPARTYAFHAFMFGVPALLTVAYLVVLRATTGVWWEPTVWSGAVPVTGVVGWLVSFIALPGAAARARIAQAPL